MIHQFLIADDRTGLPIYSKVFNENPLDETLVLGFFSALNTFGAALVGEGGIKHIKIGSYYMDFTNFTFEDIGCINIILISSNMAYSESNVLLEEISEKFAIYISKIPQFEVSLKSGAFPNLKGFDTILDTIIKSNKSESLVLHLEIEMNNNDLKIIDEFFSQHPDVADLFENSQIKLLEQILEEHLTGDIGSILKERFGK